MCVASWNADFTEVLADRLRELRKEKGLSWDSLAETLKAQYEIQIHQIVMEYLLILLRLIRQKRNVLQVHIICRF